MKRIKKMRANESRLKEHFSCLQEKWEWTRMFGCNLEHKVFVCFSCFCLLQWCRKLLPGSWDHSRSRVPGLSVCLLNFQPSLLLSGTSLIAWFSLGRPPSLCGFQQSQPGGGEKSPGDISHYCWRNMFLILHTDCVITCMFSLRFQGWRDHSGLRSDPCNWKNRTFS